MGWYGRHTDETGGQSPALANLLPHVNLWQKVAKGGKKTSVGTCCILSTGPPSSADGRMEGEGKLRLESGFT